MTEPAILLKAFGDSTRLRILRLLAGRELRVTELVEALDVPQSSISRHLGALRQAEVVTDRREGTSIYYAMAGQAVVSAVWDALAPHLDANGFFPGDGPRLDDVLRRRQARATEYFDAVATDWDRVRRLYIDDTPAFHVVASLLRPDAVLVEVGTGTGEVLAALAQGVASVVGVDNSHKMLEVCADRLREHELENVALISGQAEALPIDDGHADVAYSGMILHHLDDPALAVRELARVIKPGGKVVVSDLVAHGHEWAREVMADVWLGFTEDQVRNWLEAAGLQEITYSAAAVPLPGNDSTSEKLRAFVATATRVA
jgi:ubiquinone/menaquinone biosynthesis C-methylase UbiE